MASLGTHTQKRMKNKLKQLLQFLKVLSPCIADFIVSKYRDLVYYLYGQRKLELPLKSYNPYNNNSSKFNWLKEDILWNNSTGLLKWHSSKCGPVSLSGDGSAGINALREEPLTWSYKSCTPPPLPAIVIGARILRNFLLCASPALSSFQILS